MCVAEEWVWGCGVCVCGGGDMVIYKYVILLYVLCGSLL